MNSDIKTNKHTQKPDIHTYTYKKEIHTYREICKHTYMQTYIQ